MKYRVPGWFQILALAGLMYISLSVSPWFWIAAGITLHASFVDFKRCCERAKMGINAA